jgi:hypothetical protein
MATSFTVNKADLVFILKQIQISETHAAGTSLTQAIEEAYGVTADVAAQLPYGLRTVDGTYNNLLAGKSHFGAADTLFPRLTDPVFRNEGDEAQFNGITNTNYAVPGDVVDSDPRTISNLIVDMSVRNPAAIDAFLNNPLSVAYFEEKHGFAPTAANLSNEDLQTIPNQSPDIGLSPGFNSWMTFFGQFFDHGLDLVTKGSAGTVYVPLQPDDPLYVAGSPTNFMALARGTQTLDANGVPQHENTTTSWVDQNQTYTSHASHQVFLREYATVDGKTVATGRLLDGKAANGSLDGAVGNWAEVKAQALEMLGIRLTDFDVHDVPLLRTDAYGRFIPDRVTGYAQVITGAGADGIVNTADDVVVSGTPGAPVSPGNAGALRTGHAFLNDIAHHAVPGMYASNRGGVPDTMQVADADPGTTDDGLANTYDDELLNAHFVTGDGRGNENIALTTVHSIFHSEHNRLVMVNKATIAESAPGDPAFVRSWLLNGQSADLADQSTWVWNGERLFQAARFGTEMQYQHLVFEEFARRIQPMVDPFIFNNTPEVNPSIVAEFAHTVYRFGHSMLTGTVDRLDNNLDLLNGDLNQKTLLAVFLNPQAYVHSGPDLEQANANIIRGLSRDVGNAIDEFIVSNVRSQLLGLPLDLAALNLSRGRDTGIPSLNDTRAQLYNDTGLADLAPYTSWYDFAINIKNAASVVNFIAAYGSHASIAAATTLAGKRTAAEELVFGTDGNGDGIVAADRLDFLNARGTYAGGSLGGLNTVDLWIGGLAEKSPEFGGMLGSTFNYVFEAQMENLQFGDRLYYLTRTQGLNFLNNLEPNTFSDLVMRNTALGHKYATHLNGALFVTPDHIIELDRGIAQTDYNGAAAGNDPLDPHPILGDKVQRDYTGSTVVDGDHDEGGFLRVRGGEHFVLGGTEGKDTMYGDSGIDTLWGDGGNDYLNGGTESDDVFGGEGDDIIEDPFGDDVLRGNQGNDVITSARGADLLFGDGGSDYILVGQDASEVFGGLDNDFILGGAGKDFLLGNEGDDWIEGGAGFDTIAGENSELFFNSPIIGHDVLFGQGDETDYDAESGDDIMGSGPSVFRYEGMFGFDWGIAKNDITGVHFDLAIPIFTTIPADILRDRFDQVEGLSGWKYDDRLDGDDRGHKGGGSSAPDSVPSELFADHLLTQAGINRIAGLEQWFGAPVGPAGNPGLGARQTLFGGAAPVPGSTPVSTFRDGNILMGGDGNDFLRGRGGYDLLDGDAWLNVRIKIDMGNGVEYSAESMSSDTALSGPMAGKVLNPDGTVAFAGRSLSSLMLDRTLNPGQLSIVREIKYDDTKVDGAGMNVDTAIFQGTMAEYEVEGLSTDGINYTGRVLTQAHDVDGDGWIFVRDKDTGAVGAVITGPDGQPLQLPSSRGLLTDDRDLLKNIEQLQFADKTFVIGGHNRLATGTVTIGDATPFGGKVTPYVGQVLIPTLSGVADLDGIPLAANGLPVGLSYEWQTTEFGSNAGWSTIQTSATYTVRSVDPGHILRAVAVFKDSNGVTERIFSEPTDNPTVAFSVNENSGTGTIVGLQIPFSVDYDPVGNPPPDVDLATLHHEIDPAFSAGGRFKVVANGVDFNNFPRYSLVVDNGGTRLDYETQDAHQVVDNQYQVIINSYDAPGGVLVAQRQFTIFLNDVEPEIVGTPPTDIRWIGVAPTDAPGNGDLIGNLVTTDANDDVPFTYSMTGDAGFAVDPSTGAVTRTGPAMPPNSTFLLNVASTDSTGGARGETFTIRTGGALSADTLAGTAADDILYGYGGNDTLNGGGGDDNLFGMAGADILNGGAGRDILDGAGGADTLNGGAGSDTLDGGAGADAVNGDGGNDTIRYQINDGADTINGGAGNDTLAISAGSADNLLEITLTAGVAAAINLATTPTAATEATVSDVEAVTVNLDGGVDTVAVTSATGISVNLATGVASNGLSLVNVENVTGGAGADTLTAGAGVNVLRGRGGADNISLNAPNDDAQDIVQFAASTDGGATGDVVTNFDADGAVALDDRIEIVDGLMDLLDDNENGAIAFATGTAAGNVAANFNPVNATAIEALLLRGTPGEGVTTANLTNAALVAAAFNAEFDITANNNQEGLLVINDTNGDSFAVWFWNQNDGGEIDVGGAATDVLSLLGIFQANAAAAAGNFDFV